MVEQLTLDKFLSTLSSKEPVPGGGGASALAGALGNALGQMVANLTIGKKRYADVEDEIDRKSMKYRHGHHAENIKHIFRVPLIVPDRST